MITISPTSAESDLRHDESLEWSNVMKTISPTCGESDLRHDESLDMVLQMLRDLSASLADLAKESDSGDHSKRLIVGKNMTLALSSSSFCEGVKLYLAEGGAGRAKNGLERTLDDVFTTQLNDIIYAKQLVASGEEENRVLQSDMLLLRSEKRKLEMEAVGLKKKLDEIVAHKDSLLEAHVNLRTEWMEIEERKKIYTDVEFAFEKQKEDNLIQVEMTKDVAAMESRLDFMVKIINKEWEISQATAEVQKAKEWLGNVSSADYEIGGDGLARNKDFSPRRSSLIGYVVPWS